MSHIASISSARMAAQHQHEAAHAKARDDEESKSSTTNSTSNNNSNNANKSAANKSFEDSQISQLSLLSLSDDDDDNDVTQEMSIRQKRTAGTREHSASSSASNRLTLGAAKQIPAPLDPLNSIEDIEQQLADEGLCQANTLNRLEQKWFEISANMAAVVEHLQVCSNQVMEASSDWLQTLLENVESTCDRIDNELKAQYHLVTKCDELATKLSVAGSFRDEVKTLRKSVETLELLYKSRPRQQQLQAQQ